MCSQRGAFCAPGEESPGEIWGQNGTKILRKFDGEQSQKLIQWQSRQNWRCHADFFVKLITIFDFIRWFFYTETDIKFCEIPIKNSSKIALETLDS